MALLKRERLGKVEDALSFRQGSDSGEGKRRLEFGELLPLLLLGHL